MSRSISAAGHLPRWRARLTLPPMQSTDTQTHGFAVEVRELRKSYGDVEAVRGTVEILEGYRTRSHGDARVLGMDPARGERELRERVGIVLQQCGVQTDLTIAELIEMYGRYYERRRPVDELIELVELGEKRDVRAKNLSGGQRRRLDLALALVGDPDLIFLDEPTTGFDPAARRQAWSTVRSLCDLGKTVFLTTHYMDEAQHLADRVAVMSAGKIIAVGRPDELGGRDLRPAEIRFGLPVGLSLGELPEVPAVERSLDGDTVLLLSTEPVRAAHEITGWALERGIELERFSVSQPTLEDIYLELTGSSDQNHVAEEAVR